MQFNEIFQSMFLHYKFTYKTISIINKNAFLFLMAIIQFIFNCSEYTPIQSIEQRRRYKADFNADYAEYRELHGVVEKVSRRFAELKERLKQEDQSSPRYKVRINLTYH